MTILPLVAVLACTSSGSSSSEALPPWKKNPLIDAAQVSPVILIEWRAAANRAFCAPIAFAEAPPEGTTVRRANFSGGWAVAFDVPGYAGTTAAGTPCGTCGRSAFGLAGTGVEGAGEYEWPNRVTWSDGSRAGWGPEGGSGPRYLAYVEIEGQRCLYNIWSHQGREHLEHLIEQIRLVRTD